MTTKDCKKNLHDNYREAGFSCLSSIPENIDIYEKDDMAVHFIFFYDSMQKLKDFWKKDHQHYLVDYYLKRTSDNIDLQFNFYALFIISASPAIAAILIMAFNSGHQCCFRLGFSPGYKNYAK